MKKIVAVVLALVMVLGLATTAFAAEDKYDLYKADAGMAAALKVGATEADFVNAVVTEVAAKTNKDGSGNVAYMTIAGNFGSYFVTKNAAPTVESYAVTEAGKTTVLYYVDLSPITTSVEMFSYAASVTAFNSFSAYAKCGCVTETPAADAVYFQTAAGDVYLAGAAGTGTNYLLDGKVVSAAAAKTVVDHTFVYNNYKYDATLKTNVPTSALCTICMTATTGIYKDGKAPAQSKVYDMDGAYCVVVDAAASAPVAGDKVESAQTFDAGIAMYVGMSVMAAAGSAVVLKKKD